jgi:LPS sulfotransferase NodH
MPNAFQPLFIIGSPRSGTTMLQVLLGEHPQVSTTVELTLFTRYVSPWMQAWDEEKRNSAEGRWHQGLPFVWEREELRTYLRGFVESVYAKLQAKKSAATHILDKYPANSMVTPLIRDFLPNARFIHVIRDGRDVACSMVSAAQKIGFGTQTIRESATAWKKHLLAAREARAFGKDYLEIRYEALVQDGISAYQQVLDFCGLPYEEAWLAAIIENNTFEKMKAARRSGDPSVKARAAHYRSGRAGGWKETLSGEEAFDFERLAGDLLRELGYESSPDWWQRSALSALLIRLKSEARWRFAAASRSWRRRPEKR